MLQPSDTSTVIPMAPWLARDGFVAETAVRLDKLQAAFERLAAEQRTARDTLSGLKDDTEQVLRMRSFDETLRNARDLKLDEIVRSVRETRERLSAIEGPRSTFNGLTYRSFEAIDAKLNELASLQNRVERDLLRNGALLLASLVMMGFTLASRLL